jgi:hypothetical protein
LRNTQSPRLTIEKGALPIRSASPCGRFDRRSTSNGPFHGAGRRFDAGALALEPRRAGKYLTRAPRRAASPRDRRN